MEVPISSIFGGIIIGAFMVAVFVWFIATPSRKEKCNECDSKDTWTWRSITRDASYPNISHTNINRYCFSCCEFTERDDFALLQGNLGSDRYYKLACKHKNEHAPEKVDVYGKSFKSPNLTMELDFTVELDRKNKS